MFVFIKMPSVMSFLFSDTALIMVTVDDKRWNQVSDVYRSQWYKKTEMKVSRQNCSCKII